MEGWGDQRWINEWGYGSVKGVGRERIRTCSMAVGKSDMAYDGEGGMDVDEDP